MSGTKDYFLTRGSAINLINKIIESGTKIYLEGQYKDINVCINYISFDQIEILGQLYCINPFFSQQKPVLRAVNNIHSGLIYMIDNDLQDGFFNVNLRRGSDFIYVVSMGYHSFFSKIGGGEFFPPKPELKQCYREACKLMKMLAIKEKGIR
jgi:hypothetical protein